MQATPGEMLRSMQKVADGTEFKIKVVERGGKTVKSMMQRSDMEPSKRCWDQECPIFKSEESGMCNKENVGYSIQCQTCWEDEDKKDGPFKERK